ncbi:hypothetical protein KEM52_003376 [Ascosphaera acerosa]|nr:hypothetical protein KEM52_003376 [Ascosphaera acerosa]
MIPYGYKEEEAFDVIEPQPGSQAGLGDEHGEHREHDLEAGPTRPAPHRQVSKGIYERPSDLSMTGSKGTLVGEDDSEKYGAQKEGVEEEGLDSPDREPAVNTTSTPAEERFYESAPTTPFSGPQPLTDAEGKGPDITRVTSRRSVVSTASTHRSARSAFSTLKPVPSLDKAGNFFPEGGREAYAVVVGAWFAMFGSLGVVNSTGIFQAYLSQHQLAEYSEGKIGWIFGMYTFLMFLASLQIGPIFDAKGPRGLLLAGLVMSVGGCLALSWCTTYAHFMVVFGLVLGIGNSLIFNPSVASISHYFLRYRARATGIATSGGGVGAVVFPLMLQSLFPKIGWAWAMRAMALLCLVTLGIGCLLIRSRLPPKKATKENLLPDLRIFMQPIFTVVSMGIFFLEWGMFIPVTYISSYAYNHGVSEAFSYQILALLNVGSAFGRFLPGFVADYVGRYNTMIITGLMCVVTNLVFWLPAGSNVGMIVFFAIAFGFASGSNISLVAVCIGQVCKTESYGRYYATAYCLVSFAVLTGIPIGGQIISACDGKYWGLIVFTGLCYVMAVVMFVVAKLMHCGWNKPWAVW